MSQGERVLQERFNTTRRANAFYNNQMIDFLNEDMIHFISEQSFIFMSTSDAEGNCDSTFKAGEKGFVYIIDETQIMYPEYRGNGVMASLGNISENPHIGLLFMDFINHHIGLHVNGTAEIMENDELDQFLNEDDVEALTEQHAGRAERWVLITVHEAYIHCSKHIPHFEEKSASADWGTDDVKKKGGDFFNVKNLK